MRGSVGVGDADAVSRFRALPINRRRRCECADPTEASLIAAIAGTLTLRGVVRVAEPPLRSGQSRVLAGAVPVPPQRYAVNRSGPERSSRRQRIRCGVGCTGPPPLSSTDAVAPRPSLHSGAKRCTQLGLRMSYWSSPECAQLVPELVARHVVAPSATRFDHQRLHHAYLFTGTRGVGRRRRAHPGEGAELPSRGPLATVRPAAPARDRCPAARRSARGGCSIEHGRDDVARYRQRGSTPGAGALQGVPHRRVHMLSKPPSMPC